MEEIGYDIVEKILNPNPFVPFDGTKNIQIKFIVTIKESSKFAGLDGYYTSTFILEVKSQIIVGKHSAQISLFHFRILFDVGVNKKNCNARRKNHSKKNIHKYKCVLF
ncbi:MAG: hypothetical protein WDA29_11350 [Flavobacteriaceae bacterium]